MYSKFSFVSSCFVSLTMSAAALGQMQASFPVGTTIKVKPEVAATVDEQLGQTQKKIHALRTIQEPEKRMVAMLEAMANLAVIPVRWPNATGHVLQSYLLQADLALQHSMPRNAVDALNAALPTSRKTRFYVDVEQKLALAHERLGDIAAAETHLVAAERSSKFREHPSAPTVLQQLGMLYSRANRPREAMNRFRAAADVPGQPSAAAASCLLSALKEAVRLKDDENKTEAKTTVKVLERALSEARKRKHDPRSLSGIEDDLLDLRKKFNL